MYQIIRQFKYEEFCLVRGLNVFNTGYFDYGTNYQFRIAHVHVKLEMFFQHIIVKPTPAFSSGPLTVGDPRGSGCSKTW